MQVTLIDVPKPKPKPKGSAQIVLSYHEAVVISQILHCHVTGRGPARTVTSDLSNALVRIFPDIWGEPKCWSEEGGDRAIRSISPLPKDFPEKT